MTSIDISKALALTALTRADNTKYGVGVHYKFVSGGSQELNIALQYFFGY